MELLVILLILLAATRLCGEIAVRLWQPALVGELIAGIIIGQVIYHYPEAFPTLEGLATNEVFRAITDLGVFFLMLLAGVEMQPRDLTKRSGGALGVALGGLFLPLALGCGLGWWLLPQSSYRPAQIVFIGTALAITAVPVAIKILIDLKLLDTRVGRVIVAAAVVDDVMSLILLSILTALIRTGELPGLLGMGMLLGQIALFFALTSLFGPYVLPRLESLLNRWKDDEIEFSLLILVGLAFGVFAELLRMHFIIGAFMAGLFYSRRNVSEEMYEAVKVRVEGLTKGFLAPIFFASIGLHLDLSAVTAVPGFVIGLIGVAIAGKVIGAYVPARAIGMSNRESLAIGTAMSARGAVELIIAEVALAAGLFTKPESPPPIIKNMYSAIVIMATVTTLLTPIVMHLLLSGSGETRNEADDRAAKTTGDDPPH